MQAYIRYIGMNTERPDALADYFKTYFAMRELARAPSGEIALTDGWFKLALHPRWPTNEVGGISRFGIAVDDAGELAARLDRFGASGESTREDGGDFWGECRVADPYGGTWSISHRNFGMDESGRDVYGVPRIRHTAIYTGNTQPVLEWVCKVFGLREINVSTKIRTMSSFPLRMAGDGVSNFTILPFDFVSHFGLENQRPISAEHRARQWVPQHFGWIVPDLEGLCARLPPEMRDMTMMQENMGEYSAIDPDKNRMDISEKKGFEVDFNVWERGEGRGPPPPFIMVRDDKGERRKVPV